MSNKPVLPPMKVPPPPTAGNKDQPARAAARAEAPGKPPEPLPSRIPENTRIRRLRGLPTRSSKRPEEHEPSPQFVSILEALGPREGESKLAFHKRMCMIRGIRRLWMDTWRQWSGNRQDCALEFGIPINNITFELKAVGLSIRILNEWLLGQLELPRPT